MDSLNAVEPPTNPKTTEPLSLPAMNRQLFNVIAHLGSSSRRDAAWTAMAEGSKPAGSLLQGTDAHDCGRERHDHHTSGEGPG